MQTWFLVENMGFTVHLQCFLVHSVLWNSPRQNVVHEYSTLWYSASFLSSSIIKFLCVVYHCADCTVQVGNRLTADVSWRRYQVAVGGKRLVRENQVIFQRMPPCLFLLPLLNFALSTPQVSLALRPSNRQ